MFQQSEHYHPVVKPRDPHLLSPNLLTPLDSSLKLNFSPPTLEEMQAFADEAYRIKFAKRERLGLSLAKGAMATLLTLHATIFAPYLGDVRSNMITSEEAQPSISVVYPAIDKQNAHKATIFYDGFNTFGARYFAKTLGKSVQQAFGGEGWAVQYNNAVLDAAGLSDMVNEKIEEEDITAVDVVAHSLGGDPATEFLVNTTNDTWTNVETMTYIASPADPESLTDKTLSELGDAKKFAWIPWIEYSTAFRYGLEMYNYRDGIQRSPLTTSAGINTRFQNGNVTTNEFLASQLKSASTTNIPEKILSIEDDKFETTFNYVEMANGDSVVLDEIAAAKICKAVIEKKMNCNVFQVKSTHGGYYMTVDEYEKLFQEIAHVTKPLVEDAKARRALELYGYYQNDALTIDGAR